MKIVQFEDGTYGVKKGKLWWVSYYSGNSWFSDNSMVKSYCKFTKLEDAIAAYIKARKDSLNHKQVDQSIIDKLISLKGD